MTPLPSPTALEFALDIIKRFEGLRLTAYQDSAGVWTVGYGCTGKMLDGRAICHGLTITETEADAEVACRVGKTLHVVEAMLLFAPKKATERQLAACTSLAYNIGLRAFEGSSVRRLFNAGDVPGAADAFRLWNKAGGKVVTGLVNRREAERAVFLSGLGGQA